MRRPRLAALVLLLTTAACTSQVESAVNAPFRAPVEANEWVVSAMPSGFDTDVSVGLATVRFSNDTGNSSIAFTNACGVSGASQIDWTFDGFVMVESTEGEDGGVDFVTDSAECADPDDLLEFLRTDGTEVVVSINDASTEVVLTHSEFELHLSR